MKSFIPILCILITTFTAIGRDVESILSQREVSKNVYRLKIGLVPAIVLPMSYGNHQLISESDKAKIRESNVLSIDLVYTDFPKGQDLTNLNRMRLRELSKLRKELINDERIPWTIIKQTGCENEEEARVLFHGIVIHYRIKQSEAVSEADRSYFGGLPKTGAELNKLVSKASPYGISLKDSTVIQILERNKNWKDMLVVADLTGSMSPYSAQLLVWFQLRMKDDRVKKVVFFNDGDLTPDSKKRVGEIGGIYLSKSTKYEDVLAAAEKTIRGGGGGDGPENNCEAILKGLEVFPTAKEVILVADNFAPIKDRVLVSKISVPVRIILCGTEFGYVNTEYLDLARRTGGSVHTMETDLIDLAKKNEGDVVRIGKHSYRLINGTFVLEKKA
ncbi:hypothetical protein [Fluviicola taffensis]|uniref:Uncharacterized protein n=1 Tax=Fluviicola taffensis (strain DSM 16823 / NCIMB 13979 / RW262) TaxID=755732 RepID=F2IJG9_FLUTR|nr:hypothetical protein [Fluviicola taffensis]AEA42857.1 hypothetical protein Fluta_0856 [Fluviicola taffensis DSM 16823]